MTLSRISVVCLMLCAIGLSNAHADQTSGSKPSADQLEFFEKQVRPLLAEHCYECHSTQSKKVQAGLLVDSRSALIVGGDSGESILPGDADGSLLIEAVRYESYEMPPKGKLPDQQIDVLVRWVEMGAPWPQEDAPAQNPNAEEFDLEQRRSEHWVWQPIRSTKLPTVVREDWPKSDLDYYILNKLEDAKLRPSSVADRNALVRRIYFDLIGLPPSPKEVADYLNDTSEDATERLIDELLASPHFGERWGRHWLDLMRYAESRGHEFDNDALNAFQYRDYVIRALNADVPYEQLVREHIAGDLLEEPRLHPENGFNESILGTGFWFLGEWVHSPVDIRKDESDRFDNMIDVMSKAFLGVTVSCARCHDHKFDAISTEDYYSLTGFLESSDYRQVRFEALEANQRVAKELHSLDEKYAREVSAELELLGYVAPTEATLDEVSTKHLVFDAGKLESQEFLQDGFIFGNRPRSAGTPFLRQADDGWSLQLTERSAAVSDPFWDGLISVSEQGNHTKDKLTPLPRSGRSLRTPTFLLKDGNVACRVSGTGHVVACVDSHRLVAGPLHNETLAKIKPNEPWVKLNLGRYVGHRLHLEFTPAKDAQLKVSYVTQGASDETLHQFEAHDSVTANAIDALNTDLASQLAQDSVRFARLRGLVDSWARQREQLRTQVVRRSQLAMAMLDGTGEDGHILIRGNSSKPGKVAPRHFLTAVSGNQPMPIERGSGRLELAQQINDPQNPLTSRVIANRIWHHLMGRGIVATTDDFGVLGQRPTHPQLLDHLAIRFRENGQSIKQLIRYIMLSQTYQMSSQSDPSAVEKDPNNRLWHHRPPKRLEGEAIRDALLAVSGSINSQQFGEPVPIHLTSFMTGRGRPGTSGPLDGDGRRSIYIAVRRNFLSPFMLTFDTPAPFSSMGRRNVSNVPAQSLILMNDPFVVSRAELWAKAAMVKHDSANDRIRWMYKTAFARAATEEELAAAKAYFKAQSEAENNAETELDWWTHFAHALINTKEFIFLR